MGMDILNILIKFKFKEGISLFLYEIFEKWCAKMKKNKVGALKKIK
jgi:hypothetical protein